MMKKPNENKYNTTHKALLNRTKRISGQVKGISLMIEEERYCIDILTQVKAARSALKSLEVEVLNSHMKCCLKGAMKSGSQKEMDAKIEELMTLLKKSSS